MNNAMSSTNAFAPDFASRTPLRKAIATAIRRPEQTCMEALAPAATLSAPEDSAVAAMATQLAQTLRAQRNPGLVATLVQEFALSSAAGGALL